MKRFLLFFFTTITLSSFANEGSGEIFVNLQKLHSLKRVLYVAAHPDDENTRALAWFSLGEKAETAYFSLTRGDGGQNLIGNELSEELGVLRTQELLAARSHDGAKQYFSRAVDFGYSKSAEESFELWGREILLSDLVLIIRKFKPEVIVTRFPPDERAGHGHHTASALLAIEAFEKAADKSYEPNQVKEYGTWQSTSIYWNTSYWWDENIKGMAEGDPNYLITDIGGYNAQLGMSYNEVGTLARSEHKCQGFGGIIERGSRVEYFKHMAGEKLTGSFFEKSKESWSKMGDKQLEKDFQDAINSFDFIDVSKNVPRLIKILKGLKQLPSSYIVDEKISRCETIIKDCLGLHAELVGDQFSFTQGDNLTLKANLINRSGLDLKLSKVELSTGETQTVDSVLLLNDRFELQLTSNGNTEISNPYWLNAPFTTLFEVKDPANLCAPESRPSITARFTIMVDGEAFGMTIPATYKWRDPSYGERRRPFISTPDFTASFEQKQLLMKAGDRKEVRIKVKNFRDSLDTKFTLNVPEGWRVKPQEFDVSFKSKHAEEWLTFTIQTGDNPQSGTVMVSDSDGNPLMNYKEIAYDHIPTQALFRKATMECKVLDAKINEGRIAYIKGVEDAVPQAIEQLGFTVDLFEVKDIPSIDFSKYQTVVLGIRIYNVHPELFNYTNQLNSYVENGGNLVMQYNTASRSIREKKFGPVPFELSRNRVTEEDAVVTFLAPDHQIMTSPNAITKADFDNWVQERGLYFANNWDENYTPLFSWADKGEDAQTGALIVTKYGKGQFVYSGISFFRELPNGVIGAYRLFANILSYQP
ncbi:MAG: PIG-L family deacetylase [Crocinitomicaceae bacterium]|nr:PIG-L family deacetylase [Crocinitomicaceae bacterium]